MVYSYPDGATCRIDGCNGAAERHWMCHKHYTRQYKHGDTSFVSSIRNDDHARFRSLYSISDNGCWNWNGPLKNGYGRFFINPRNHPAHRASWMLHVGPIPEGMQINHKCHNRACVNPAHLYPGTQQENMRDMVLAGRGLGKGRGESNHGAKLTEAKVLEIRGLDGTTASIARQYGVSESLIRAIRQRKAWRHV